MILVRLVGMDLSVGVMRQICPTVLLAAPTSHPIAVKRRLLFANSLVSKCV